MAEWWSTYKNKNDKLARFGFLSAVITRPVYSAPRSQRHLPAQVRVGWVTGERGKERVQIGRRHLLVRPSKGVLHKTPSVTAKLLPAIPVPEARYARDVFEQATQNMPIGENEIRIGMSDVRRVRIEGTGVVALERTQCTQMVTGQRKVTLFWGVYVAGDRMLRMSYICTKGDAPMRTYRTQVAGFLCRWTAASALSRDAASAR